MKETERLSKEKIIGPKYPPPFVAFVTIKGLRITIKSILAIVDTLFAKGFKYVLTGKLNQDCLEVIALLFNKS